MTPEGDNFYHWLHYHRLTEPQLKNCVARAESPQEYSPRSRYDVYEYARKKFHEIHCLLLNPPADLPSAAYIAEMKAQKLLKYLAERLREFRKDSTIKRHVLYTMELQRDVGQQMSSKAFINIGHKAKLVRKMSEELGDLLALTHSLLFDVERLRVKSFAIPNKRQFFENKAWTHLKGIEVVYWRCSLIKWIKSS